MSAGPLAIAAGLHLFSRPIDVSRAYRRDLVTPTAKEDAHESMHRTDSGTDGQSFITVAVERFPQGGSQNADNVMVECS